MTPLQAYLNSPLKKKGKMFDIDIKLIQLVLCVLAVTEDDLMVGMIEARQRENEERLKKKTWGIHKKPLTGPDQSTFDRIFRDGAASSQFHKCILSYIQITTKKRRDEGLIHEDFPILMRLDIWPPELRDNGDKVV